MRFVMRRALRTIDRGTEHFLAVLFSPEICSDASTQIRQSRVSLWTNATIEVHRDFSELLT